MIRNSTAPVAANKSVQVYWKNAFQFLPRFDFEVGDIVVTDPPYGTGGWRVIDGQKHLVSASWDDGDYRWVRMCNRVPVVAFCPAQTAPLMLNMARQAGYSKFRCLYWQKPDPMPNFGRTQISVEPIWILSNEGFDIHGGTDVFSMTRIRSGQEEYNEHPYQKPLALMRWIIDKLPAKRIIDPFMGSGSTLQAAWNAGVHCVGFDIDNVWCQKTLDRLRRSTINPCPIPRGEM